ncbi:conserved hypothetical protein [Mucispirillum schaedleri ASF457]|jgi:protein TonB|uniref:TonB C-terminal domain-containing protein n=2 Tax=Mucispirillum TaxID=248038 RepID=V2Q9H5_9BACT|nr:hypothetical protein N508_000355 [Mucispirillum schaedleri ASF457]SIW05102.1 conserved hypothetical protein [Mucispirillum schaedleri ASF457]
MYGDMKSYKLLAVTIFLSLLLHILIIYFVKFTNERQNAENHPKGEPVEIEVIPKEETGNHPYSTEPETDDIETTLDHDVSGGKSGGSLQDERASGSGEVYKKDILPPKAENKQENSALERETASEHKLNLYDNKDIIDRIANAEKEQPKGEDSASYNVFEERYASYFAKFRRRVYQLWEYPADSIRKGETGVVKLSFSILKDGSIVNIRMLESSGYSNLDREVMRVIKNMGKIPLPESYELNQLNIEEAYFVYSMGSGYGRFLE